MIKASDAYFDITSRPAYNPVTGNPLPEYVEWMEASLENFWNDHKDPPRTRLEAKNISGSRLSDLNESFFRSLEVLKQGETPLCPFCGGPVKADFCDFMGMTSYSCSCGWGVTSL